MSVSLDGGRGGWPELKMVCDRSTRFLNALFSQPMKLTTTMSEIFTSSNPVIHTRPVAAN